MKLLYVLQGKVALHYNGERHLMEQGDSPYLDGGMPRGRTWAAAGPTITRPGRVISARHRVAPRNAIEGRE